MPWNLGLCPRSFHKPFGIFDAIVRESGHELFCSRDLLLGLAENRVSTVGLKMSHELCSRHIAVEKISSVVVDSSKLKDQTRS